VYERRGWLYAWVGYCNSPLNKRISIIIAHVFFPSLGFHINHCVKLWFVVLGLMCTCSWFYVMFCFHCPTSGIKAHS
jgi:hypothetical protein